MENAEHLDAIAACVYREKGRSLRDTCWLLNKAGVENPNGRKDWLSEHVAASVLRDEQRERDKSEGS